MSIKWDRRFAELNFFKDGLLWVSPIPVHFHLGCLCLLPVCWETVCIGTLDDLIAAVISSAILPVEVLIMIYRREIETVTENPIIRFLSVVSGGVMTGHLREFIANDHANLMPICPNDQARSQKRILSVLNSQVFRIAILATGYVLVTVLKYSVPDLAFFLDYLSVILICVSSFWFGLRGGLIGATVTFSLFLLEGYWNTPPDPSRHYFQNQLFSFFFCYGIGIILGLLAELEAIQKLRLRDMAYTDELTGCVNFRLAMQVLEREISRATRFQTGLTIMILDIDDFKQFNDRYGHQAGNRALKEFASAVRNHIRKEDTVSRFGGDEFLVILPQARIDDTVPILTKIRDVLQNGIAGFPAGLRFSAGISYFPLHGHSSDMLFNAADNALYEAKKNGKNTHHVERRRFVRYVPEQPLRLIFQDPVTRKIIPDASVMNISSSGMLITLPASKSIRQEMICRDSRLDGNGLLCKVVYRKKIRSGFEVGVTYPILTDQTLHRLVGSGLDKY